MTRRAPFDGTPFGRTRRVRLLALALAMLAASGCRGADPQEPPPSRVKPAVAPATTPLPGTARMARALAGIRSEGDSDPFRYYHTNRARAAHLRAELDRASDERRNALLYDLAVELVNAGALDEALQVLDRLAEAVGPDARTLSARSKPLFELEAIAHLRKAELDNCVRNHAPGACILPLTPDAIHTRQEGARRAAALYEQLLDAFPDDLGSRWLLNVAYMTLGRYPGGVPEPFRIDGLAVRPTPTIPRFPNVAPALGVDVLGLAGGVCLEDFTGDGLIDIMTSAYGLDEQLRFFVADGAGGFVDHTEAAGLQGLVSGLNLSHADYDNDGDADVLVLRGAWLGDNGTHPNSLLRNNGDGTFEDVTEPSGLLAYHPSQTGVWADFNNDGWLDLFVGNESGAGTGGMGKARPPGAERRHPSSLYLNNGPDATGTVTFTDVARRVGVDVNDFVKGAAWGDVDNDGLRDLYVSIMGQPNRLFLNRGGTSADDWRFDEAAGDAGVRGTPFTFPAFFWDYDNDGREDLFVASFDPGLMGQAAGVVAAGYLGLPSRGARNHLYRNDGRPAPGPPSFTDVAPEVGLDLCLWTMGLNYGDLDGDGFLDVYFGTGAPDLRSLIPNRMFLNQGGRRFVDVTFDGGFGHLQKGHAIAFADFDRDGDEDLYAVMGGAYEGDAFQNVLFENPGTGANAWVVLRFEGRTANRSAIGARLRLRVVDARGGHRYVYRTVSTGGSFGASSLQQEIGLGPATRIAELQVTWPNREQTVQRFTDLPVNHYYSVAEGRHEIETVPAPVVPLRTGPPGTHRHAAATAP